MIIDLRAFKQKGIFYGDFDFDCEISGQALPLPDAKIIDKVNVKGQFDVGENSKVFLSGKIVYRLLGECSRCLTPVTKTVEIEFDEVFSQFKSDEDCYAYSNNRIDLTEMVNELIILESPQTIYCKDDCKGICPHCGKNLNEESCDCGDNL